MGLPPRDLDYLKGCKKKIIDGCPECAGTNLNCKCYPKYLLEVAKVNADIPIKFRSFALEMINSPESKKIVAMVRTYMSCLKTNKEKGRGIYLWGGTGNAKTALACIVLMEALRQGYSAYFTDLSKCMDFIAEGWTDEEAKDEFGRRILNSEFLVIDDVGREYKNKTGFVVAQFDMIFRERANNLLPTILTSNLAPADVATDFGKRLWSILHEHLFIIETNSKDYRKVLARANEKEIEKKEDKQGS